MKTVYYVKERLGYNRFYLNKNQPTKQYRKFSTLLRNKTAQTLDRNET